MAFDIRPATPAEMSQLGLLAAYVYGGSYGDEAENITSTSVRPEWTLCAFDGATMAASFAAFPFKMRANGRALDFAGVTAVGTAPEYRRRGLVRQIVTRALAEQRERGQSMAGLWASQAAIYQRYGYAAAGVNRHYAVDTVDIRFFDGDVGGCRLQREDPAAAMDTLKALYREFVAPRFGYLHRSGPLWTNNVLQQDGNGPVHAAVAYAGGQPRGYVIYTLRSDKVDHAARGQEIIVRDLVWLDLDAYRSIWHFLGQHDLVGRVRWQKAPLDDPAPELFFEPRMLHARDQEGSWMRVVDAPTALQQRGYLGSGEVGIEVHGDDLAPWNNGAWLLQADNGAAQVTAAAGGSRCARMSIKTLSSLYTGMHSARRLAGWGLIEADGQTLSRLDEIFAVHAAPHSPDHY